MTSLSSRIAARIEERGYLRNQGSRASSRRVHHPLPADATGTHAAPRSACRSSRDPPSTPRKASASPTRPCAPGFTRSDHNVVIENERADVKAATRNAVDRQRCGSHPSFYRLGRPELPRTNVSTREAFAARETDGSQTPTTTRGHARSRELDAPGAPRALPA